MQHSMNVARGPTKCGRRAIKGGGPPCEPPPCTFLYQALVSRRGLSAALTAVRSAHSPALNEVHDRQQHDRTEERDHERTEIERLDAAAEAEQGGKHRIANQRADDPDDDVHE